MTVLSVAFDTTPRIVDSADALAAIHASESPLAIWHRPASAAIGRELTSLPGTPHAGARTRVHAGQAREQLTALLAARLAEAETAFPAWLSDLELLTDTFFQLADGRPITARLETLDRTGCPRFHVDHSCLRLVCAYRGPGTEWLDEDQVDRVALDSGAPNEAIIRTGCPNRMPTFAVGVMKGSRYPGHADAGLVHRSPAFEPGNPPRVLFCLDC